jgi:hypothetical protein
MILKFVKGDPFVFILSQTVIYNSPIKIKILGNMLHIQGVLFKMQPTLQDKCKLIYDMNIILFDTSLTGYASQISSGADKSLAL